MPTLFTCRLFWVLPPSPPTVTADKAGHSGNSSPFNISSYSVEKVLVRLFSLAGGGGRGRWIIRHSKKSLAFFPFLGLWFHYCTSKVTFVEFSKFCPAIFLVLLFLFKIEHNSRPCTGIIYLSTCISCIFCMALWSIDSLKMFHWMLCMFFLQWGYKVGFHYQEWDRKNKK